jgi:hypothetical protein
VNNKYENAARAEALLNDPIMKAAFDSVEANAIEAMISDDHDEGDREDARQLVKALRLLKEELIAHVYLKPKVEEDDG